MPSETPGPVRSVRLASLSPSATSAPPSPSPCFHGHKLKSLPGQADISKLAGSSTSIEELRRFAPSPSSPSVNAVTAKSTLEHEESESEPAQDALPTISASTDSQEQVVDELAELDWDELEKKYDADMAEKEKEENEIYDEFNSLVQVFSTWAQAGLAHDSERGFKRLRTRIAYVQEAEVRLAEKEEHYNRVVQAFQSALQLLGRS